jgi:hypothetical protein
MIGTGDGHDLEESLAFGRAFVLLMAAVALALVLFGCTTEPGTERTFYDGSTQATVRFSETTPLVEIYATAEACAGLTGDPYKVKWYALDGPIVFPDGRRWTGAYDTDRRAIYYLDPSRDGLHEALHDLLWTNLRRADHPSPPFGVCVPPVGD